MEIIPKIFARVVEQDTCALGVCADYLEDNGINVIILRAMENPCSTVGDESGYHLNYWRRINNNEKGYDASYVGQDCRYGYG